MLVYLLERVIILQQRKNSNYFDELTTQAEPPAMQDTAKAKEVERIKLNTPSLLPYLLAGGLLGYIALKI